MKTLNNFRQYFPVIIFSTILIASTIGVNAQNYRKEEKKENGRERKEYRESDRRDDQTAYNDRRDDRGGNYIRKNWNNRENDKKYRPKYNNRNQYYESNYFEHPRYGRVYQRFDHNPLVFHHDRDDYYYYGNHFYSYRKGVGYCVVEPPRNMYFRQLPVNCERVHVNGKVLFRNGDLFFQLSPRGYALVNVPGVSIFARF
jgi:hypothetical protein